MKIELN